MTDSAQKLVCMLRLKPQAMAKISGSIYFPDISGTVSFRKTTFGTLVTADIKGLPFSYEVRKGKNGEYTTELWIDRRKNSKSLA